MILILAAITLLVALIFLPWSELGFNGNFPDWLADLLKHMGILDFVKTAFNGLANHQQLMKVVKADHSVDNIGDYAYSLFLFVAICAASIGIILIGREENSEKTVLEAKK